MATVRLILGGAATDPTASQAAAIETQAHLAAFTAALHAGAPAPIASQLATQASTLVRAKAVAAGASEAPGSNASPIPPAAAAVATAPMALNTDTGEVTHGNDPLGFINQDLFDLPVDLPVVGKSVTPLKLGIAGAVAWGLSKILGR